MKAAKSGKQGRGRGAVSAAERYEGADGLAVRGQPGAEPGDVAGYIREVTGELRDLADGAGFALLAYLLDMARLIMREAVNCAIWPTASAWPP